MVREAGASRSGGAAKKKKWSKGKVKEKVTNTVFLDQETYEKLYKEVPKYKLITPAIVSERLHVNGSLARQAIRELLAKGQISLISSQRGTLICSRAGNAV